MLSYVARRLSIIPCLKRVLREDRRLFTFRKVIPSRELSSAFPEGNCEDKYGELNKRLVTIPCLEMLKKEEDRIRHDLCYEKDECLEDLQEWNSKVFDCNARNGNMIRAATLLKAYCTYGFSMDDSSWCQWDSEKWRSAVILAWCMEMLQASGIMLDDLVDQSLLRRGEPCWYTRPNVGLGVVNDALFLTFGIYKVLHMHFAGSNCFMNLIHEINQAIRYTTYGEGLDIMFHPENQKPRFDLFSKEKYLTLIRYKTGAYTICLPVHLAMHLAGKYPAEEFEYTRELGSKLGLYYGIVNDYIDCFGKLEVTGKDRTDISGGKCTWLSVKFLELASEPMKKEFFENYGVKKEEAVAKVLELYKRANLPEIFKETKTQLYDEIYLLIESKNDIKGAFFYDLFRQSEKLNSAILL